MVDKFHLKDQHKITLLNFYVSHRTPTWGEGCCAASARPRSAFLTPACLPASSSLIFFLFLEKISLKYQLPTFNYVEETPPGRAR
jgi:hypothetical protein